MSRAVLPLLLVALAGCQGPAGALVEGRVDGLGEQPSASFEVAPDEEELPSRAPSTASSLDPLAIESASRETISDYLALTDEIGAAGGEGAGAMARVVTTQWLATEESAFEGYRERRIRTIGTTTFDNFIIQSSRITAEGLVEVAAFLCVDSSNVWVVNKESPEPPEDFVVWLGAGDDRVEPTDERYEEWSAYLDEVAPVAGFREPILIWLLGTTIDTLVIDATENWVGNHPCGEAGE